MVSTEACFSTKPSSYIKAVLKYLSGIVKNQFHYGDSEWHFYIHKPVAEPYCTNVSF